MDILVTILLIVVAVIFTLFVARNSGKDSANKETQDKVLTNVTVAKKIEDDISSLSSNDVRDRLRKRSK